MRLLRLDPVFDELRGLRRLRIWLELRLCFRVRGWLVNHEIVKPARRVGSLAGPKPKRRLFK